MKSIAILLLCFFLSIQNYAQNKTDVCELQLTLNEFIKTPIQKSCFNRAIDEELTVLSFKIKIPNYPTTVIHGNQLNKKVISYLTQGEPKNVAQIFDIKLNDKTIPVPKNILLTVISGN